MKTRKEGKITVNPDKLTQRVLFLCPRSCDASIVGCIGKSLHVVVVGDMSSFRFF